MKHETKNTLSVQLHCNHCKKATDHRVDNGRPTRICIPCQERGEIEHQARVKAEAANPRAVQEGLFA